MAENIPSFWNQNQEPTEEKSASTSVAAPSFWKTEASQPAAAGKAAPGFWETEPAPLGGGDLATSRSLTVPAKAPEPKFGEGENLYDYENAKSVGLGPNPEPGETFGHWPSRVPTGSQEGLILKHETHPTFPLAIQEDIEAGYQPFRSPEGRIYTFPKDQTPPEGYKPYELPPEPVPAEQIPTFGPQPPLPMAIAPMAQPSGAAVPPPAAAPAPSEAGAQPQPTFWESFSKGFQEGQQKWNRFGAGLVNPVLELAHGLARGTEKTINLVTGQSPDWTWQNSPTGALTQFTQWLKGSAAPEMPREDEPISKWTSNLLGTLASYMVVPAAFKAAGAPLPMAGAMDIFGKGIPTAERVNAVGQTLATNLLNFGIVDVAGALDKGGGLEEAKQALANSMQTAALFTIAGALPFEKVVANPWLVKAMESTATGGAFAGSAALQGERNPYALATSFLTGFGLHALTSGGPMALDIYKTAAANRRVAEARQNFLDDTFNNAVIDWKKTNKVTAPEWEKVQNILDEITRKPVETGEGALPETPQILNAEGRPIEPAQATMMDPETRAALEKPSWARNAQEKFLADQVERQAKESLQAPAPETGPAPSILPGEPGYRPLADRGEATVDRLGRAADLAGKDGQQLSDLLANNQDTIANAFRTGDRVPGIPEITDRILDLSQRLEDTGDPNIARELSNYIDSNLGALKGLPRWPVGPAEGAAQTSAVRPGEAAPTVTPPEAEKTPEAPPERVPTPVTTAGNATQEVAEAVTPEPITPATPIGVSGDASQDVAKPTGPVPSFTDMVKKATVAKPGKTTKLPRTPAPTEPQTPEEIAAARADFQKRFGTTRSVGRPEGLLTNGLLPGRDTQKEAVAIGKEATAQTADGQVVPVKYVIVPLEDLVASHTTSLNENAGFPQEFQPRDRSRKASMERLGRLEGIYDPAYYGATPAAWDGAPIVGPDMLVESGNGRVILNRRGAEGDTVQRKQNQQAYQNWLKENAESFGIDPAKLEGVTDPVLVRMRTNEITAEQRRQLVRDMNVSGVEQISDMENAVADGKALREANIFDLFNPNSAIDTAENLDFRTAFMSKVLNPMEASRYIEGKGEISPAGLKRIRNAVFAAAYGEGSALEKMADSNDDPAKNITTALMQVAPRVAKTNQEIRRGTLNDLSISKEMGDAAAILVWIRENQKNVPAGMTPLEYYLRQNKMFEGDDPFTVDIVKLFDQYKGSAKKLRMVFNNYLDIMEEAGNPRQPDMFGEAPAVPSREAALNASVEAMEAEYGKKGLAPELQQEAPARGLGFGPETPGPEAGPGNTSPGNAAFSLGSKGGQPPEAHPALTPEHRPLTKFEMRLKGILDEYPDADPHQAALAMRLQPQATDEQIAKLSRVSPETLQQTAAATQATLLRKAEAAKAGGGEQGGLFGEAPPPGGLFEAPPMGGLFGQVPIGPVREIKAPVVEGSKYAILQQIRKQARGNEPSNITLINSEGQRYQLEGERDHAKETADLTGAYVTPEGKRFESLDDALRGAGPGSWKLESMVTGPKRLETADEKVTASTERMRKVTGHPDWTWEKEGGLPTAITGTPPEPAPAEKQPWEMNAQQYQGAAGVHEPWIMEISPYQYGALSGRQKRVYDAKREREWQASADIKSEWRDKIHEAWKNGDITKDTPGLSDEAKTQIFKFERDKTEVAAKEAIRQAYEARIIRNPSDVAVGDKIDSPIYGKNLEVIKVNPKSIVATGPQGKVKIEIRAGGPAMALRPEEGPPQPKLTYEKGEAWKTNGEYDSLPMGAVYKVAGENEYFAIKGTMGWNGKEQIYDSREKAEKYAEQDRLEAEKKAVGKGEANAPEAGGPAPEGAAPEPQDRRNNLSEAGEGRSRELADFQSRRSETVAGQRESAIYADLKPASDAFAESPTFKGIEAEAQGRGIQKVIPVSEAKFDSVLVPEADGSHTLLVAENVSGRGTHAQLADHEYFHHDITLEDPRALKLVRMVNQESPAFQAYADTVNRIRASAGLEALPAGEMAIEVAADFRSGMSQRSVDGRDIDLANAFHPGGFEALASLRGEILPPGTAVIPAQPRGPPNKRMANPDKLEWPRDRVNKEWTIIGMNANGGEVMVRKAPGRAFIRDPAWEVRESDSGGDLRFADQQMARDHAAKLLDYDRMARVGYEVDKLFSPPDEFKHLRAQAPEYEKGVTEKSKKTGEVISEQKPLFSLAEGEARQGWIDTSNPLTLKQFETRLEENDSELWKRVTDPASKMIPLYEGERYVGTRAGNVIENSRGKTVVLSKEDVWKRLFQPEKPTLPLGQQTARKEDLLGTPEKPGPEGTIEAPPERTLTRSIREKVAAASISEKADFTQQSIIKNSGWAARDMAGKAKILDRFNDVFAKLDRSELLAWTDAVEKGNIDTMIDPKTGQEKPIPPELQEVAKIWRRMDDGLHVLRSMLKEEAVEEARASGQTVENPETAYWENHFPRLFKNPQMAAILIRRSFGSSLTGPEGFNKIRTMLLFSDSIKPKLEVRDGENGSFEVVQKNLYDGTEKVVENFANREQADQMVKEKGGLGLEPLTDNYADMMKGALWEQLRYINGKLIENDLKAANFISRKDVGGWERYQGDKTLEGYYIHPDAARVMDNFLSKGLRGDPAFDFINDPATFFNGVMVSASFFHASLSIFSSMALGVGSNLTRAVGAAFTGRYALSGHYLAELAKTGGIPLELVKGSRMLKEYEARGSFPEWSDMVDLLTKGGIRAETRSFKEVVKAVFSTGTIDKSELSMVSKAFNEIHKDGQLGLPRRIMDVVAWPIMSYVVPRLKIAATAKILQLHLDEAKDKGFQLTEDQQIKLAQECARKADNIFGQMVYDNLSMSRGLRDAMRIFIGFPGWNIGSLTDIMQAGQGITHMVGQGGKMAAEAVTGRKPTWEAMSRQSRMSLEFYLGTVMVVSVFGALTQRLLTGEWPSTIKDLLMPRTGSLMANGQPERMRFPTYLRDVLSLNHPIEMLKHKENWPIRLFTALADNQDFFGEQIRDPFAGPVQQLGQATKYIGKSLMPFALQGYQATEDPRAKALNFLGVVKVPRVYSNTPAMNLIDEYNKLNRASITTKEAAEEKRLKTELRKYAANEDQEGFQEAARTAMEEGKLTRQQIKTIVDQSQAPPGIDRFIGLPVEWQVRAWKEANPQEKELWEPYFMKKVMTAKPEILLRNRDALLPVLEELGLDDTAQAIMNLELPDQATQMDLGALGMRKPSPETSNLSAADEAMARAIQTTVGKEGAPKKQPAGPSKKKTSPYSVLGF